MNTEEIACIVGEQRAYFRRTLRLMSMLAAAHWCACAMRFVRSARAISPMRSRPIWESRMTRHICARSARRFPRFAIRLRMWPDGAAHACAPATSPMPLVCARRKPCPMASRSSCSVELPVFADARATRPVPLPRAILWSSSRAPMLRHRARCSGRFAKKHLIRAW